MVLTRSQTAKNNQLESIDMDYLSDTESETSFPDCNSRRASNNVERANLFDGEGPRKDQILSLIYRN